MLAGVGTRRVGEWGLVWGGGGVGIIGGWGCTAHNCFSPCILAGLTVLVSIFDVCLKFLYRTIMFCVLTLFGGPGVTYAIDCVIKAKYLAT